MDNVQIAYGLIIIVLVIVAFVIIRKLSKQDSIQEEYESPSFP